MGETVVDGILCDGRSGGLRCVTSDVLGDARAPRAGRGCRSAPAAHLRCKCSEFHCHTRVGNGGTSWCLIVCAASGNVGGVTAGMAAPPTVCVAATPVLAFFCRASRARLRPLACFLCSQRQTQAIRAMNAKTTSAVSHGRYGMPLRARCCAYDQSPACK